MEPEQLGFSEMNNQQNPKSSEIWVGSNLKLASHLLSSLPLHSQTRQSTSSVTWTPCYWDWGSFQGHLFSSPRELHPQFPRRRNPSGNCIERKQSEHKKKIWENSAAVLWSKTHWDEVVHLQRLNYDIHAAFYQVCVFAFALRGSFCGFLNSSSIIFLLGSLSLYSKRKA